jgi:hypothetical protein
MAHYREAHKIDSKWKQLSNIIKTNKQMKASNKSSRIIQRKIVPQANIIP